MKKWVTRSFIDGSPQAVITHGQWQRKRGRRPSMPYGNITNPFKALQAAKAKVAEYEAYWSILEAETDKKATMLSKEWRDDGMNPGCQPTTSTIVVCAKDIVRIRDPYVLRISHVKTQHGHGFVANIHGLNGVGNGDVHLGESAEAYNQALQEGYQTLQNWVDDLNADIRQTEELDRVRHAHR